MKGIDDPLNLQIDRACMFLLSTYPANGVTEIKLQNWSSQPACGDRREVQSMHDCYAVLHHVETIDEAMLSQVIELMRHADNSAPSDQRLGQTQILVVQIPASNVANTELCRRVVDSVSERSGMKAYETLNDGSQLAVCGDETWVLICGPQTLDSCHAFAVGPLRLFETLRHKVLGQYAEYENAFRQPFLDSTAILQKELQDLSKSWSHPNHSGKLPSGDPSSAIRINHKVTHDYTKALLKQAPVKQIETMLAANLRNLEHTVAAFAEIRLPQVLQQHILSLEMLLAQVRADIHYAQPILEAAKSVTQAFHTEMLADLAVEEAVENQQRASNSTLRERHVLTLTLLGLWIGLNQLLNGWLSLPEPVKQWSVLHLLGCLALPTILTSSAWLFFASRRE